jgi:hypothetical protein
MSLQISHRILFLIATPFKYKLQGYNYFFYKMMFFL